MPNKRHWCSGNISDFHSEAPVSITGWCTRLRSVEVSTGGFDPPIPGSNPGGAFFNFLRDTVNASIGEDHTKQCRLVLTFFDSFYIQRVCEELYILFYISLWDILLFLLLLRPSNKGFFVLLFGKIVNQFFLLFLRVLLLRGRQPPILKVAVYASFSCWHAAFDVFFFSKRKQKLI